MKILNLYSGIGGNRKMWGNDHDITAVEIDESIATIYKDYFPDDRIIIDDAHDFLINNFSEFDFIWSSPPCPTHSKMRYFHKKKIYPDMSLYQEIILLRNFFEGKYVVENVESYYKPLITPSKVLHRHFFWSNFQIGNIEIEPLKTCKKENERKFLEERFGYDLNNYTGINKRKALRNCVVPKLGLHILKRAEGVINQENTIQGGLFK